jgi:uncharacterized protein
MARLTYSAPGVYVEEVPSAQQPIAPVGTNTVGFIGYVQDHIYVPVKNPDFDPVMAQTLFDYRQLLARAAKTDDAAAKAELQAEAQTRRDQLDAQVKAKNVELTAVKASLVGEKGLATAEEKSKTAVGEAEEALGKETDEAKRTTAAQALTRAQNNHARALEKLTAANDKVANLQQSLEDLGVQLKAAEDAAAGGGAETGGGGMTAPASDAEFKDVEPDAKYLRPTLLRPYYLKKITVPTSEFATKLCTNFSEYAARFGDFSAFKPEPENKGDNPSSWYYLPISPGHHALSHAIRGFFDNGGSRCFVARVSSPDSGALDKALEQFESIDDVAIIAAPGFPHTSEIWESLQKYCEDDARQNVFAILDSPGNLGDGSAQGFDVTRLNYGSPDPLLPRRGNHAAFYFPHVEVQCPAKSLQDTDPERRVGAKYRGRTYVAPSGHVAGIYARTDEERGVHKAPANAAVRGALGVRYYVSKPKQELLNPQGVNCIRIINGGVTLWGARTIGGDANAEWKYVSVRRFAGFLEESIDKGTQWVVFEPNDTRLWSRIILNITAFLTNVWRSGALFGLTPQEAFYVKCDAELNPPEVRDLGQVITEIGVAIVRPAEFVIFRITQSTGLPRS